MQYFEDELDYVIHLIIPASVKYYIRAPVNFSLELFSFVQADPATWALEVFMAVSSVIVPLVMSCLMILIGYDAFMNPKMSALLLKNVGIFRELVVSKMPPMITGLLPGILFGN